MENPGKSCPLCTGGDARLLGPRVGAAAQSREYWRCAECALIFVPEQFHLEAAEEKARYEQHHNGPDQPGYVKFLEHFTEALVPALHPGARGLDFGCGPGPTVATLLTAQGFAVENYDPYFALEDALLAKTYDFITCTEVAEHWRNPRLEFTRLCKMLRPGGVLGIRTEILLPEIDFSTWWYARDPTHIAFYSRQTLEWVADWLNLQPAFPRAHVVLLHNVVA